MHAFNPISNLSLLLATSLILITLLVSYRRELKLEKEIIIGSIRAVVQLLVVGYILNYIFGANHPFFTLGILLVMLVNAAYNAGKRGKGVAHAGKISFVAIGVGAAVTLAVLLGTNVLSFTPYQMIPVGGMVISGAMVAIGLCYRQIVSGFDLRREEVEIKLALGATPKQASKALVRSAVRMSLQPTIDSSKTLGIVSLPGMMTGLILAGMSPLEAIKYQVIVTFMSFSTISIACYIASHFAYQGFFNKRKQLIR